MSGMAMMAKSMLGIDPNEIMGMLNGAMNDMKTTLAHFDARLVAQTEAIAVLREEIHMLRRDVSREPLEKMGLFDE